MKLAVRLELLPAEIVVGFAVKLEITGTALTVTVAVAVAGVPLGGVTVKVYVVVVVGLTLTAAPLVAVMPPGVIMPEPPLNVGIKLEFEPASIVDGEALKPLISGGGPVIVVELPPHPVKSKNATLTSTANITDVTFRFMKASICSTELKGTDG